MINLQPMTEAEFQSQVLQLARLFRWHSAHFRPGMTKSGRWVTAVQGDGKGFPDLVLVRDRVLWVELKTDTGKLRPEQVQWVEWLKTAGQEVYVWRPLDWDQIQEVLR